MKQIFCAVTLICLFAACKEKKESRVFNHITFDKAFTDSVAKQSDSTYTKNYYRTDYVTADYYINHKDSTTVQVMRDSAGHVRQVISTKKDIRNYFAQYYSNGQLQANLKLDVMGRYEGPAVHYYENGAVKSKGNYSNGFNAGEWKEYNEKGDSTTVKYNADGNRVN